MRSLSTSRQRDRCLVIGERDFSGAFALYSQLYSVRGFSTKDDSTRSFRLASFLRRIDSSNTLFFFLSRQTAILSYISTHNELTR